MNKTYNSAMTAIMTIENVMKNKGHHSSGSSERKAGMAFFLFLTFVCVMSVATTYAIPSAGGVSSDTLSLSASENKAHDSIPTKEKADAEYMKGDYQRAIQDYELLLKNGASADMYYNLGNAYYRTDNITKAVLNYERAALMNPSDKDIQHNLQIARSKTIDKMTPKNELFFITSYRALVNFLSIDGWAILSIFCISLAFISALLFLFANQLVVRKTAFFAAIVMLVLFILSILFAYQQKEMLLKHRAAIVTAPSATIMKTPAHNSTQQAVVHEGTRVEITDDTMQEWKSVRLPDGRQGWLLSSQIEPI